jgi:hypothetical protein
MAYIGGGDWICWTDNAKFYTTLPFYTHECGAAKLGHSTLRELAGKKKSIQRTSRLHNGRVCVE